MTQKIPFEPFMLWKDMYEQTEKAWHDVIQTTLGKESFSEGLGQIQNSYLQYHEMMSNWLEVYMKQANIPTPDEIANVATLVINLEEKVDKLDDQLYDNQSSASLEISQLKQSVTALDQKLDQILAAFSSVEKKIEAISIPSVAEPAVKTPPAKKKPTPRKKAVEADTPPTQS